jgi:hypothetical protein
MVKGSFFFLSPLNHLSIPSLPTKNTHQDYTLDNSCFIEYNSDQRSILYNKFFINTPLILNIRKKNYYIKKLYQQSGAISCEQYARENSRMVFFCTLTFKNILIFYYW